jgi:hypothetical protein
VWGKIVNAWPVVVVAAYIQEDVFLTHKLFFLYFSGVQAGFVLKALLAFLKVLLK